MFTKLLYRGVEKPVYFDLSENRCDLPESVVEKIL